MTKGLLKKLFIIMLFPLILFSQEGQKDKKTIDESLNEQIVVANQIIKNINEEKYLNSTFDEKKYDNQVSYLLNRINVNQRANNAIAVKRDEIRLLILQEKRFYENTLRDIIRGKKAFKDKNYFINLINDNIKLLRENSSLKFEYLYKNALKDESKVSQEFIKEYLDLKKQSSKQSFTLNFLLTNMNDFRKSNFLIDNFNLKYLIKSIDSQPIISSISDFMTYYLKFSIGDIIVVILILIFFRLLNTRIISILTAYINNLFIKKEISNENEEDEEKSFQVNLQEAVNAPLITALYTLAAQLSIYILIKDEVLLNKITPWINTLYMAQLTWALYSILTNSISNYAQHLISKYPNVRREMIVFILRITKIILILLVVLFLFTQLGIDIKAIAASLGVGGIAIALASKDTLANFFGSLNIMTDNSFSQGDWIVANTVEGTVVDIRMRTTRIRTFDNAMITVPNSELANANIKNYSKRRIGRRIKFDLGITYESDMNDIINLKNDIYEMLNNHPHIATNKNSILGQTKKFEAIKREDLQGVKKTLLVFIDSYGASSINILIYCFTRSPNWEDWLTVKEDVLVQIAQLVKKNNCGFAYPTQTLFLKNDDDEKKLEEI